MSQKINENGELIRSNSFSTISRKNVSVQPVGSSKVIVYDFVNTYEPGPSGTKEDYRVIKKPKKVDEYDIKKVIHERTKGADLKSIVARLEKTGDMSLLNQRTVVYGDGRKTPRNLSDALQKGVDSSKFLDSLTASEKERMIQFIKDPMKFEEFIKQNQKKKDDHVVTEEQPKVVESVKGE